MTTTELFLGTFEQTDTDNMDEALKSYGASMIERNLVQRSHVFFSITNEGDLWKIEIKNELKKLPFQFLLGETFKRQTLCGFEVNTTIYQEGNKLIFLDVYKGEESKTIYDFSENTLKETLFSKGVNGTRNFKKITAA